MILREADKKDYKAVRRLYNAAFPAEERAPFGVLKRRLRRGLATLLIAEEEGTFVGFVYAVVHGDVVYFFYFAVEEKMRGAGRGSEILRLIKEYYKGKRIFLAREQLDESAENYEERVRRRNFYMRNGFSDISCVVQEATVVYDVMCWGGSILPEEYNELIRKWAGKFMCRLVKMEARKK